MPYLNVDLDYFDHRKTKRLIGLLGRGSEVLPIRLWTYCGKFHCDTGAFTDYSDQEIESIAAWWGKPGEMLEGMARAKYMHQDNGVWFMTEFLDHQGHLITYKLKGKAMARARWDKAKADAVSIAGSIAVCNARTNRTSQPIQPTERTELNEGSINGGDALVLVNGAQRTVELMAWARSLFGEGEMQLNHARWLERAESEPSKLDKVLAETSMMKKENRIKTTPAQYAEDFLKRLQ